jgi:hypothetical protein
MKKSNFVTCLRKKTKFRRCCLRFDFDRLPKTIVVLPIDHAWKLMVGTTMDSKSSNFVALKLVRFSTSVGVDHGVANTPQTPIVGFIEWPPSLLHLCCSEQVLRNTSNKLCMKEHSSLFIHVIQDLVITLRRA